MSNKLLTSISRRSFVGQAGAILGALTLGTGTDCGSATETSSRGGTRQLPRRVLGKTDLSVTCMTLGTAPCGIAPTISPQGVAGVVDEALDLGINFVDTSPIYGNAEEGVGLVMARRRKETLLATKVWADTVADAQKMLAKSLATLKTDYVDVLYFHQLGQRDIKRARNPDGVFTWLLKQKKAGVCRFVGISAHNLPGRFPAFLQTGEVDVILVMVNFVDRYTYNFEQKVLPIARKHNAGIVAMKVFGGPDQKTGSWGNPKAITNVGNKHLELAVRYALSIPGLASVNLGVHNVQQLRQNVEIVKRFQALSSDQQAMLAKLGRTMAAEWGTHRGPVEENTVEENTVEENTVEENTVGESN